MHYKFKKTSKEKIKAKWMAEYEKQVVKNEIEKPGKVDWDTAHYFYYEGLSVKEAIEKHRNK